MNLKNLFKHKQLESKTVKPSRLEEGLVYAVSHHKGSSIFLYTDGQNDILLGDRWHTITSLCTHNNWLYDGGYKIERYPFLHELNQTLGFVIDTITGKDIVERKNNPVYSLCSHNGTLYKGGYDGIFEALTGKKIASRQGPVTALCSHEGVLYDTGADSYSDGRTYKGIFDTFKSKTVSKKYYTKILCSHEGDLYGIGWDEYAEIFGMWILFDVLKNKKISKTLELEKGYATSMCSYMGNLYGGTYTGIHKTFGHKNLLKNECHIAAMCSIPAELAEQIRHTHKYGFNFNDVQRINPKGFIEYLTNASTKEEKQKIINQLFNCEYVNEDVIDWLNKNEKDIMRKAAFY